MRDSYLNFYSSLRNPCPEFSYVILSFQSRRNSVSIPATEFEQSRVPAEAFVATAKVKKMTGFCAFVQSS